jgi:F420-0:gamma-glutamyl ligase
VDALADILAASANLLFGQTDEATHVVIVRGLKYEKSEKGIKDVLYPRKIARRALLRVLFENVKFKIISTIL